MSQSEGSGVRRSGAAGIPGIRQVQPDKWIEGIDPAASPAEATRLSLEQRLKAVWHFLQHAEDDVEYVHHLRVATRRSMAVLRLFRPMLPKKRTKALMRDLRRTREAAGTALLMATTPSALSMSQ